ncbi:multicomponent K+:H+ antiporter subunit D [Desulfomicrobium macestii]|uniref:Multicomponent K+:H+ antiporter subunit D n=1 Tax=Desulfomicrobium macestii TaxID=90731 RepID=A0ABR9H5V5_9BACT|nr:monovalent cation/H+ antiporter subunit D [Desulfomicrobium macestii]MBE1426076.1 multicomponent K+:H+ antiporter subunit D [Desulfomicrobium macestii]
MNHLIMIPLLLPLAAGMTNLLLVRKGIGPQRLVSVLTACGLLAATLLLLVRAETGHIDTYELGNWPAPFGIILVLDRLSALMLVLTAFLTLPVLLHACSGDDKLGRDFHVIFPLQIMGLNGAFLTGDLFNLFVFFEILLIASYCLALHGLGPERTRNALRYVVLNLIGSSLFLIALGTLYGVCGTLNMADLALKVAGSTPDQAPLLRAAGLLLLAVFGFKAAILPLFLWLPGLYAAVLPSVAALFAIMTKVGVYAILRTQSLIFTNHGPVPEAAGLLFPVALATLAAGSLCVLGSRRLRVLLAWLVIVSVGTLLAGIGLWNVAGISASLYYLPHSTLVTAGLFLLADHLARQRGPAGDVLESGPTMSRPNLLGSLFLLGAMAIAGLPPLSGFIGKLLLLNAAQAPIAAWLWPVVLGGSLIGIIALGRCGSVLFWKTQGDPLSGPPVSWLRLAPAATLLLTAVALSVMAGPVTTYTDAAAEQLLAPDSYINAVLGRGTP